MKKPLIILYIITILSSIGIFIAVIVALKSLDKSTKQPEIIQADSLHSQIKDTLK